MATRSSILAWRIPWAEDPGKLQSMGSQRVGNDWVTITQSYLLWASQLALMVKNRPANAGDVRDMGSIPGSGRSPGGGHSHPLQYSCLQSPMDRGAWQAQVHRVWKSQTWLKWLSMHAHRVTIMVKIIIRAILKCCLSFLAHSRVTITVK